MSPIQAILLGMIYWLNTSEMFVPFTYMFINSPLVVSTWVGLILGDLPTAVTVGATVMPMYLALVAVGGAYPIDKCAAGIISGSMVITQGISLDQALVLAAAAALIMAQLHTIKRLAMVWTVHHADRAAERGDIPALYRNVFIYGNLIRAVIFWIPMSIILYVGSTSGVGALIDGIPGWINNALSVAGGMMPALGFAMTIMVIGHGHLIPFFLAGFMFTQVTGLGSIYTAMLGLFLAWLFLTLSKKEDDTGGIFGDLSGMLKKNKPAEEGAEQQPKLLDKKTLNRSWFMWWYSSCAVDNVERLQALAFCVTMAPVLRKLYPDQPEEIKAGLKRHLTFFITENLVGQLIPGIVISLEEERAMGANISDELITGIKTGLMGPLAGIGDTLNYSTIWPLLQAFFIPYGQQGMVWAPIACGVIGFTVLMIEGRFCWNMGYRLGRNSAMTILQNNVVQKVITFFSIMGLFVMGGLAATTVDVQTAILLPKGDQWVSLQHVLFDAIIPGLFSLVTIFLLYNYLKRGGTILKATLIMLVVSLALGSLGILGTPNLPEEEGEEESRRPAYEVVEPDYEQYKLLGLNGSTG